MILLDTIKQYIKSARTWNINFKNEQNADLKVKTKMIIYYWTFLVGYFAFLSLMSPDASSKALIFHIFLLGCSLVIMKTRSSGFIKYFFFISSLLGLYIASQSPENVLNVIGLALVQHNQFFAILDKKILKFVTIITSLVIVCSAQRHLTMLIDENDIPKILEIVKGLQHGWIPLYFFNHFSALSVAKNDEMRKANEERGEVIEERSQRNVKRALIVDDIPFCNTIMTCYLKKINIEVDVAKNGEEAVEKFKEKGFGYYSFITMDTDMPRMNGMIASEKIREYETLHRKKDIPIIIVTGECTKNVVNSCLDPKGKIRALYFCRQPILFSELKSFVKTIIDVKEESLERQ